MMLCRKNSVHQLWKFLLQFLFFSAKNNHCKCSNLLELLSFFFFFLNQVSFYRAVDKMETFISSSSVLWTSNYHPGSPRHCGGLPIVCSDWGWAEGLLMRATSSQLPCSWSGCNWAIITLKRQEKEMRTQGWALCECACCISGNSNQPTRMALLLFISLASFHW